MIRAPGGISLGTTVYAAVCVAVAGGLALVAIGPWRWGMGLCGLAFALAGVVRLLLPEAQAGLLRVRRRGFDVVLAWVLAAVVIALALSIPDQAIPLVPDPTP